MRMRLPAAAPVLRLFAFLWSLVLIALMATGTVTSAHIGTMTWGVGHDVWSATIAISNIKFGLKGYLGYHEVERAMAEKIDGAPSAWTTGTDQSEKNSADPAIITSGFRAASMLTPADIVVPSNKAGYLVDWCEDLGYADFYNIAFRLFGVNAFSTHWLYISILTVSVFLFAVAFRADNMAMASLVVALSSLFLVGNSGIFQQSLPSFAANRFVSTLAIIPMLHVFLAFLRLGPLRSIEAGLLLLQALLLAWTIGFRTSGEWTYFAIAVSLVAVILMRANIRLGIRGIVSRIPKLPDFHRLAAVAAITLIVAVSVGTIRNHRIDERYFWDDELPHHLVWHSAWLGLTLNPDWHLVKPYADLSDVRSDSVGFMWFQHRMAELGQPYASSSAPRFYRARIYEKMLAGEFVRFLLRHPIYDLQLYAYDKPKALIGDITALVKSISPRAWAFGAVSLLLSVPLLAWRRTALREMLACYGLIWACSLLPPLWAYPAPYLEADQFDMTLVLGLIIASASAAVVLRAATNFSLFLVKQNRAD